MSHLPPLVSDLALILITAGVVTILFKFLKQPVVLGYIVAGILISPHFGLFPNVADSENVSTWAEIGVIFLLFSLGLEFSFKKLIDVGGTASIGTFINMGSMIVIGYIIGQLLGWTNMESVFLGGMLSMSSTTIIIKAFNDMGLQKKRFAGIVFGMLIVEDLAAILMMVLLSTVAVSQHFEGTELIMSALKLVFFMVIWFVVGIYMIPTLLNKFKRHLNDETLLIVAIGMCLGMVLFADAVGFSAALGAFIMGSILAETLEAKHIEHLVEPLKNLFGAVFFVSVGMMISPDILVGHWGTVLLFTVVVLVGRVIFATLGVLASGEGLKVATQAGFSLAQIGEFSFIIATLGMQLGVLSDFIYPIIVAVSVITTFTTPYCIKFSVPVYHFLEKRIPSKWEKLITGYTSSSHKSVNSTSAWNILLKNVMSGVFIYFIVALAVLFLCSKYMSPLVLKYVPGIWGNLAYALITILLMSPFMKGILGKGRKLPETKKLWNDNHFNKGALIALNLMQIMLCVVLIQMVLIPLFPHMTAILLLISIIIVIGLAFAEGFGGVSHLRMENRFFRNLNDKEIAEDKKRVINKEVRNKLLSKNIHIEKIEVPQSSNKVGKTLQELNFKQSTGIDIVSIIRGSEKINIPDGSVRLFPFDKLIVAATDDELQKFMASINYVDPETEGIEAQHQINISQYEITEGSPLIDKMVRESRIREDADCMVVGIERGGNEIVNFPSDMILKEGDILWLAGEKDKLDSFEKNIQ